MDAIELDAEEQRVLGCLLEKQWTVPASYPMTLNALRTACNQLNSRDPVVDYDDATVEAACRRLKDRGLVQVVWADRGPRTLKYHQRLEEQLGLAADERALLTLLLLRGPQSPGELRTRAERLHAFADRVAVEQVLARLAAQEPARVRELPRRPGQQDHRWVHLLGPAEDPAGGGEQPAVDREVVLVDGVEARDAAVVTSYDAIAAPYAEALAGELAHQHLERWLLGRVVDRAAGRPVLDAGCGPGHVAEHLRRAGADVTAVDLSPGMVAEARSRFPDLRVEAGDLRRVMRPPAAHGWGAVLAWFSFVHLAESELVPTVAGLARVLDEDGWLVVAVLSGDLVRHADERYGRAVDLTVVQHRRRAVLDAMAAAGLVDVEWVERGARPEEGVSDRLFVLGRRQG